MSQKTGRHLAQLARRLLWRDARSGELNVLIAALLIAVTTVTGIGLFADRISRSIVDEAGSLLAADAQITGSKPLLDNWKTEAQALGLQTAELIEFQAMAFAEQGMQLSSVKAASEAYPLKGIVKIADAPFESGVAAQSGPAEGTAWVNSRLASSLSLTVGSDIGVGDVDLTVSQILISEPDDLHG